MLLNRSSVLCTQLDISIPCSAHPDPAALGPSHTQSAPSPGAVTILSTTWAAAAQAAASSPLLLPSPAHFCSHLSSQATSALPELPLGHPPLVTPLACSRTAHRALTGTSPTAGMQEFLKWEIAKETLYLLEKKAWQIQEIFGETSF